MLNKTICSFVLSALTIVACGGAGAEYSGDDESAADNGGATSSTKPSKSVQGGGGSNGGGIAPDGDDDTNPTTPDPSADGGESKGSDSGTAPASDAGATPPPTPGGVGKSVGVWGSAAELAKKPMSGAAWNAVMSAANGSTSKPDVSNQDDNTNVNVLAAAIVYARTNNATYKSKVEAALASVVGTEKGGRSLAWGREAGAYAMAADFIGYRTPAFEAWLRNVADGEKCSQLGLTLRGMFYKRPNNWGTMAFGSLTAIYAYLGDTAKLKDIRDYWVKGVEGPNPGYEYGDTSWQASASDLRSINAPNTSKQGVNLDGIIPDDMRRGAGFTTGTPTATGYPWEHMQGVLMGAYVLDRAGMPIWNAGSKAIYRASYALQVRVGGTFKAGGDDLWQLAFLDRIYGTNWSGTQDVFGAGKNAGFAYVLP